MKASLLRLMHGSVGRKSVKLPAPFGAGVLRSASVIGKKVFWTRAFAKVSPG
jgi:hypothetical protein